MIDIQLIRDKPELVREAMEKVGEDPDVVDRVRKLDSRWREVISEAQDLKARRNRESKKIGQMEDEEKRQQLIDEMRQVGDKIDRLDEESGELREKLDGLMLTIPNIPHEDAPVGADESENIVRRTWGDRPEFDFEPRPHWELGEELGIINFEQGRKISGSRFYVLHGRGSQLQRALVNWMLDVHVTEHDYKEVYPPFVVRPECLVGTGNLPKFSENLYRDEDADLWLIPTAEVPLTNLHRDEILDAEDLPIHYTAYTACFRREKMHAGQDVRGIKRGHQFDKVELMKYVRPETSDEELTALMDDAEDICRKLGLPYRIKEMCTGDLSFVACRKYDIELWAAGCQEWLEVSSCSNFRDFQARRANIRYRPEPGADAEPLHTINGSGLALPRLVIAIMENYQQEDGSIVIPEPLRDYMRGAEVIEPR